MRAAWRAIGVCTGVLCAVAAGVPAAASGPRGASDTLSPVALLTGAHVASGAQFGYVTAVSGATIAVGAPYFPGGGRVFVFQRTGARWRQTQVLHGANTHGTDVFGVDVKVAGTEMIVGADQASGTGRAYVFTEVHGVWRQQAELGAAGLTPGDHYGLSVAISGSNAIVSTEDDDEAFIYHHGPSGWVQSARFTGQGEFGYWVGISGSTAVVGADEYSTTLLDAGAIYVYELRGTTWVQAATFAGSGIGAMDHFGQNLAISGNTIVVNAPYHHRSQGRVYVFTRTAAGWHQSAYVVGAGATTSDVFGWYVAISGDTFVAGMPEWPRGGPGSAFVFRGAGASWKQVAVLKGTRLVGGDQYGSAVGISGNTVVVGTYDWGDGGAADVFQL